MPLRRLTGRQRLDQFNWQLAGLLAFVAGAVDVSGYLALHQFTSHMSGLVAGMAADVATSRENVLLGPLVVLSNFLFGAAACAVMVNWLRRRERESVFAAPVLLEAVLIASLAFFPVFAHPLWALALFSFSMGLQNAVITKISDAEIRTTHVTGMITDIGIQMGKLFYFNRRAGEEPVRADRRYLGLLALLVTLFFAGGTLGGELYPRLGFHLMLPLALLLALPTILPVAADLRRR